MVERFSMPRITGSSTAPEAAAAGTGQNVMIGESDALKRVWFCVEQVASIDTTVLILGETGTGKELVARAIHSRSARRDRTLVNVNCATLPAMLIESELFGHERGAFTGATARQLGRFELAHGGTIFLDEIGDLPLNLQAKLLRVLQEGEFERLGERQNDQGERARNRGYEPKPFGGDGQGSLSLGSVLPVKHVSDQCAAPQGAARRYRSFGE